MTNNKQKSAKLAALIKKTAQKLVINPKQLQKLALTLPLLALFVEEVRAAQGKGDVFEDLQTLTEFVDAQNLDEAQYSEIEASLDGVQLAANDVTAQDAAAVAEEETEKAALLQEDGTAAGKKKAAALLEPTGEAGTAGRGLAAEAAESDAAGLAGEHAAAAATESFELAGLVIPVAPVPLIGAIAAGLGIVANAGGTTNNTETATGSTLSRTLKELKTDGILFVQPAAGNTVIDVVLGTGTALTDTTGVALFGDTSRDGTVSAAEDSALQVNLIITNATQLAEVAALSDLAKFGIDSVRIDLSSQDLLTALTSDATLAADLAAIRASGLTVTTIDMGAAATLTEAQVATLIDNGLSFAADDTITVTEDAGSTHLSTSLKDLQKLGVDTVTVTGAAAGADLHVTLGNGAAIDTANGALPSFGADSALNVTLDVNGLSQLAEVATLAGTAGVDLAAQGLDNVSLNLAGQTQLDALLAANVGSNSSLDQSLSAVRNDGLSVTTIDIGSIAAVHLTDSQASALLQDGLHFAANDMIEVQAAAGSTHLSTSLKDLQKLGVDMVTVTGAAAGADLHVALGEGAAINFTNGLLPSFGADSALNVTLDVTNASQLAEVATLASDINKLGQAGIDQIDMASNAANISQAQAQALVNADVKFVDSDSVTMNIALDTDDLSLDATKAASLQNAGIDHFNVDAPAIIDETFAHLMLDHHLDFASANDITLNVIGTHMGTSLADLQKLGVDHVAMNISNDADLNFALNHTTTLQGEGVDLIDITTDAASINLAAANALANANIAFSAEDDITLGINADPTVGSTEFVAAMTHAQDLKKMGVDHIDFLSNAGWLNDVGATKLIDAGIDFAAEDDISLRLTNSSYVAQHAVELSKLGVDHVEINTVTTDFDQINTVAQTLHDAGLATFDMDIFGSTLQSLTDLQTLDSIQNNGIDFNVHIAMGSDVAGFNQINGLAFSSLHPDVNTTFGQLIGALQEAGIHDYIVDGFNDGNSFLAVPDTLAAALQEAGMLYALPDANFKLDATHNATFNTSHQALNTSLSAMSEMGIDEIVSADTVNKLFVELGNNTDVASIIAGFETGSVAPTQDGLFGAKDAGLVIDQATFDHFSQFTPTAMSDLLSKLSSLGFTEIDVLKGAADSEAYHINVTAQTPVLDTAVQILGTDAQALLDVFGTDILDKKIS